MSCIVCQSQNRNMTVVLWEETCRSSLLYDERDALHAPYQPCHVQETQTWSCKGRPCLIIPFLTDTPCTWQSEIEGRGVSAGEGFRKWAADGENRGKTLQGHKFVLVFSVLAAEWCPSSICAFVQKKFSFLCWGISLSSSLISKDTFSTLGTWPGKIKPEVYPGQISGQSNQISLGLKADRLIVLFWK